MDIGTVTRKSGIPASTLRYYEEVGLINSTGRNGLRRLFDPDIIEQLSLITLGKNAGFSLKEIKTVLRPSQHSGKKTIDINREKLLAKADELNKKIIQLSAMRDGLRHAANCPIPNQLDCPKFRRILGVTRKRKKSSTNKKAR